MIGNNSHIQKFSLANTGMKDAFGRFRVSGVFTEFNSKFEYSKQRHLWWEVNELGAQVDQATHNPNPSSVTMPIPAVAGRKLIRQSKDWPPYQNGNSHRPLLTAAFGAASPGIYKQYGLFSNKDGVYFEQGSDGIYYIVLRSYSSGQIVERRIPQSLWNVDTFSSAGKNPSGINELTTRLETPEDTAVFSLANANILDIDLEWLAAGEVSVGLNFGRETYFAHIFRNAGFNATTYMSTASLPIRYEIGNITGANTGSMTQICQTLKSEGGSQLWGTPHVCYSGLVNCPSNVTTPVIALRPKSLFYNKENRVTIIPISFSLIVSGNIIPKVELVHEAGVGASVFTPVDSSVEHESASEFCAGAALLSLSGGHIHKVFPTTADQKGTLASGGEFVQNLTLNRGYIHTVNADAETYGIRITPPGQAIEAYASIDIAEIY